MATKPQLERVDPLGEGLAAVDVRWPAFDKDGQPRIRVALTRTMG